MLTISPVAVRQLWLVGFQGVPADADGGFFGAPAVQEQVRGMAGDLFSGCGLRCDHPVQCFRPFEDYKRPLPAHVVQENAVLPAGFFLQNPVDYFYAGVSESGESGSVHLRERIAQCAYNFFSAATDEQIGAGWRFSVMCARLKAYVDCCVGRQLRVTPLP